MNREDTVAGRLSRLGWSRTLPRGRFVDEANELPTKSLAGFVEWALRLRGAASRTEPDQVCSSMLRSKYLFWLMASRFCCPVVDDDDDELYSDGKWCWNKRLKYRRGCDGRRIELGCCSAVAELAKQSTLLKPNGPVAVDRRRKFSNEICILIDGWPWTWVEWETDKPDGMDSVGRNGIMARINSTGNMLAQDYRLMKWIRKNMKKLADIHILYAWILVTNNAKRFLTFTYKRVL